MAPVTQGSEERAASISSPGLAASQSGQGDAAPSAPKTGSA